MTREFDSNFEDTFANEGWTVSSGTPVISSTQSRSPANSAQVDALSEFLARNIAAPASGVAYYMKAAVYVATEPSQGATLFGFWETGGTDRYRIRYDPTVNAYQLWDNASVRGGNSPAVNVGEWNVLELMCRIDTAASAADQAEARMNGVTFATDSADRFSTLATRFFVGHGAGGTPGVFYLDDVIVNDSQGATDNSWPYASRPVSTFVKASTDVIVLSKGALAGTGAASFAALLMLTETPTGSYQVLNLDALASGGQGGLALVTDGGACVAFGGAGGGTWSTAVKLPRNEWGIIAATKPAGSANGTMHVFPLSTATWAHGTGWTARGDIPASDRLILGSWHDASDFFEGPIALVAGWDRQLSQAEVVALAPGLATSVWQAAAPKVLLQSDREPVLDVMGTAAETSRDGAALAGAGPPGWTFYDPSSQILLPDADIATTGWATAPLHSKLADASDATVITGTLA